MNLPRPSVAPLITSLTSGTQAVTHLKIETSSLTDWDSTLLVFLKYLISSAEEAGIIVDRAGLPANVAGLLKMSESLSAKNSQSNGKNHRGLLESVGKATIKSFQEVAASIAFLGEMWTAFFRFLTGRARFQFSDLVLFIDECGVSALPIVALIAVMTGAILAFVGAVQLALFGAQIYVADLVAIGMTREMAALMTAIIMAGRTGSAFAAQLGTMQVNEEIDAFKTTGLPIIEFLVFPRAFALLLMAPFLYVYALALGIFGGVLVAVSVLDLSLIEYLQETRAAIDLNDVLSGLIKSFVFAFVVAYAGCMRGIQCGRSSSAVGLATTSAMVTSIVLIVVSDTGLTLIYTLMDF